MARDCPDRQRGTDWRNSDRPAAAAAATTTTTAAARPAGRIGDAVDREYESLMQELQGGGSGAGPQGLIESGSSYDAGQNGYGGSNLPPWQRGATGSAAPWSKPREERESGGAAPWAAGGRNESYGYSNQNSYGAPPPPSGGSSAPWQQAAPPPPGGQNYAYDYSAAYAAAGYTAAPGMAAPPGMPSYYGTGSAPPPPPGDAPPPPVSLT